MTTKELNYNNHAKKIFFVFQTIFFAKSNYFCYSIQFFHSVCMD